jgi:hypothetical protein
MLLAVHFLGVQEEALSLERAAEVERAFAGTFLAANCRSTLATPFTSRQLASTHSLVDIH